MELRATERLKPRKGEVKVRGSVKYEAQSHAEGRVLA